MQERDQEYLKGNRQGSLNNQLLQPRRILEPDVHKGGALPYEMNGVPPLDGRSGGTSPQYEWQVGAASQGWRLHSSV